MIDEIFEFAKTVGQVSAEEEEILRELGARGVEVEIRGLAEEPKVDALKLI